MQVVYRGTQGVRKGRIAYDNTLRCDVSGSDSCCFPRLTVFTGLSFYLLRFQMWKSSAVSITKNSHRRVIRRPPRLLLTLSLLLYIRLQLILVIGYLQALYHTVIGEE